jgi:hypothetical protein
MGVKRSRAVQILTPTLALPIKGEGIELVT